MEKQDSPQSVWYHPESIAVITAKTLNEADIPCFLWGDYSISLWGVNDVETVSLREPTWQRWRFD